MRFFIPLSIFSLLLLCGCESLQETTRRLTTNPNEGLIASGMDYLTESHVNAQLPGLDGTELGKFRMTSLTRKKPDSDYPVKLTYRFDKIVKGKAYHYALMRESEHAGWRIISAWKTDPDGSKPQVLQPERFPVHDYQYF